MLTCNKCNSDEELKNLEFFEREGKRWRRGDCLKCNWQHEFRVGFSVPDGPTMFIRDVGIPIPDDDDHSAN